MSGKKNMEAMIRENQSLGFDSIAQAREALDRMDLTPAGRREATRHLDRLEAKQAQEHVERSNKRVAVYRSEVENHDKGITADHREADEVFLAVKRGQMSAREGKRRIRALRNRYQERIKVQNHLKATAERWDADVDAGPEAHGEQMRGRFGSLGTYGVTIPASVLAGEVSDD